MSQNSTIEHSTNEGVEKAKILPAAEQMETSSESKEGGTKSGKKNKTKSGSSNASVGKVTTIPIQDISRIANQTHKLATQSRNTNFLYLSAGANKLLPTKGNKPKPKRTDAEKSGDGGSATDTAANDADSQGSTNKYSKVGDTEDIPQSTMTNLSKNCSDKNKTSVNKDFLLLSAGANELLPGDKGSKKKSKTSDSVEGGSSDVAENENGKRPHSPDDDKNSDYSRNYRRDRDRYRNQNYYEVNDEEYNCKVCDVILNSAQTWYSHIEGKRHQKKLAAYQPSNINPFRSEDLQYVKKAEGCRINRREEPNAIPHIQQQIEGLDEPCVGLNFVSEIWRLDESLDDAYFCSLCGTTCMGVTIISHVVGYKHRLAYMKAYDTVNYEKVKKLTTKKSELTAALQVHAESLEKSLGPGQIKVEMEVEGFVPPLETGKCFQDSNVELTPFEMKTQIHHISAQNSLVKTKCVVKTESSLNLTEMMKPNQHADMSHAVDNLKRAMSKYTATDTALGKRLGRFVNSRAPYHLDEPPYEVGRMGVEQYSMGPMDTERFGRPCPPSYGSERFGAARGRSSYFNNGPRRWQGNDRPSNLEEERSEQGAIAAAVFDVERRHEMRPAQSGMPTGNTRARNPAHFESSGNANQINIPPFPFANNNERRNETPYNPQSLYQQPPPPPPPLPPPTTTATTTTGREIWAPIQSRKSSGVNSSYAGGANTSYLGGANTSYSSGTNTTYSATANAAYSGVASTGYSGGANTGYAGGANTGYAGGASTGYAGGANTGYAGGANTGYAGGTNTGYAGGTNTAYAAAGTTNKAYSAGANPYAGGVNSTYSTGANAYSGGVNSTYANANYANYTGNE